MLITKLALVNRSDAAQHAWQLIRAMQSSTFALREIERRHQLTKPQRSNAKNISRQLNACITQATEYMEAAERATLATKPVLLYYAMMSFALSEVLIKQDGDSRLEKLRTENGAHGLDLPLISKNLRTEDNLINLASALRARPQYNKFGRFGTFEVWRRSVRELPLAGPMTVRDDRLDTNGEQFNIIMVGSDEAPPPIPDSGLSLLDALTSIPCLAPSLSLWDAREAFVGGVMQSHRHFNSDGSLTDNLSLILHGRHQDLLEKIKDKILFTAEAVNSVEFDEYSGTIRGLRIRIPNATAQRPPLHYMPPSVTMDTETSMFYANEWKWGEEGAFYVALHICGNMARYYPEIWMAHIESSSPLANVIDQLCRCAFERLPVLVAGELHGMMIVAKK